MLFLSFCSFCYGQNQDTLDVIRLRNGMIIEGMVAEYREGRALKLALEQGIRMKIQLSDIESIEWAEGKKLALPYQDGTAPSRIALELEDGRMLTPMKEVVRLTNGRRVSGRILSYEQEGVLKMIDEEGRTWEIEAERIDRVVQSVDREGMRKMLRNRRRILRSYRYAFTERGTYYSISLSTFSGGARQESPEGDTAMGFHILAGYQWRRLFGLGLGLGIDGYDSFDHAATLVPVYLEARGYFLKRWQSPYYAVRAGYALSGSSGRP